jgi:hypothetical protein
MPCNKCGEPTEIVESSGGTTSGEFREVHECVRGHRGYVTGDAEKHPKAWDRYGSVFDG